MRNPNPQIDPSGTYTTCQAAELLGISRNTLWKYTKLKLVRYRISSISNRRVFSGAELLRLWQRM